MKNEVDAAEPRGGKDQTNYAKGAIMEKLVNVYNLEIPIKVLSVICS